MSDRTQIDALQPGDLVAGKYRVNQVLGVGGMGVVVAATHEQLDQRVALKFLHAEFVGREDVVARFLREARAAVRIRSEHVARVLDVGSLPTGAPYMVMEFLEGEDLEHRLERGPLPEATAVGYLLEACEAIAEAHSLGIVHRDLKPANLFLATTPGGVTTVKVLDFGISKAPLSDKEKALTQEATLMGTPAYMSPEQMRASRTLDARSDIWSLGVILHELITASLPFEGDSMATLLTGILALPHAPAGIGRPSPLQPAIDRCLEKDPERRFANVAELAEALVPFGPPRAEQSLERISTVLGRTPGDRSSAVIPAPTTRASTGETASPFFATVAVTTGGTPAAPTRRSGGLGEHLILPAVLIAVAVAISAAFALRQRHGADTSEGLLVGGDPSAARDVRGPPIAVPIESSAPANPGPTVMPEAPSSAPRAESTPPAPVPPVAPTAIRGFKSSHAPTGVATAAATSVPTPPPAATAPTPCKVVSYYDAEGTKHFRKDCP